MIYKLILRYSKENTRIYVPSMLEAHLVFSLKTFGQILGMQMERKVNLRALFGSQLLGSFRLEINTTWCYNHRDAAQFYSCTCKRKVDTNWSL